MANIASKTSLFLCPKPKVLFLHKTQVVFPKRSFCNPQRSHFVEKPEEPTGCCGNGCQNCVWLDYWEQLELYSKQQKELGQIAPQTKQEINFHQVQLDAFQQLEKKL